MDRQHCVPVLLASGRAVPLTPVITQERPGSITEADIQKIVQENPACLPIGEVDALFSNPVPICTELSTPAGSIDNFMVTPSGLPVLVECKLWRNPEGRREVVGQVLDYAKELSKWSCSDLQREVNRRLKKAGNALLEIVQATDPDVDEVRFNDALTINLRRGRFLLLIVGDGIREGVEAIAEYLQQHVGLHFSLGLVEMPFYSLPNGDCLVVPRVLARTINITRNVIAVPEGHVVVSGDSAGEAIDDDGIDTERVQLGNEQQKFWEEFLTYLKLDDPEQSKPIAARLGSTSLSLPASVSWLTVYRDVRRQEVGVYLSSHRKTVGAFAMQAVVDDWDIVKAQLGGTVRLDKVKDGRTTIWDSKRFGPLDQMEVRKAAFLWLAERVNTFVNVIRPRIRSAAADYRSRGEQG